jgi:hypothetical protein
MNSNIKMLIYSPSIGLSTLLSAGSPPKCLCRGILTLRRRQNSAQDGPDVHPPHGTRGTCARAPRVRAASGVSVVSVERRSCRSRGEGAGVGAAHGEAGFASVEAESGQVTVGSCARNGGACCATARASAVTTRRSEFADDSLVGALAVAWCLWAPPSPLPHQPSTGGL